MKYIKDVAKIKISREKCVGCGVCINVCPHAVIAIREGVAFLDNKDLCIECGACDTNCPVGAIQVESGVG